ncbi:MAG: LEA type 2 family protein [Phycisphaerales bacterium]|jgi:LEA14-like dessication related protein|nr:LEA type 2 family protein [Phycisphaerales bacterium]
MKIRSISKFAALGLVAILLGSSAGCTQKPTASITGMKLQGLTMTDVTMLFDVKVDNPYLVALPLGNLDYALASQGQQFLNGNSAIQGTIPAGASKTLPVPLKINFMKLIDAVKGARPGASIPYKADMGLSLDVPVMGALRVPMSKEGSLDIPTQQDLINKAKSGLLDRLKGMTE